MNPFWAGVLATIIAEMLISLAFVFIMSRNNRRY